MNPLDTVFVFRGTQTQPVSDNPKPGKRLKTLPSQRQGGQTKKATTTPAVSNRSVAPRISMQSMANSSQSQRTVPQAAAHTPPPPPSVPPQQQPYYNPNTSTPSYWRPQSLQQQQWMYLYPVSALNSLPPGWTVHPLANPANPYHPSQRHHPGSLQNASSRSSTVFAPSVPRPQIPENHSTGRGDDMELDQP